MKIIIPNEIQLALAAQSPVAVGVSGGKDSCAVGIAVHEFLTDYSAPKILIHSDLGLVEWKDSLPTCQRLSERLGWPLIVVRRHAGDMMDRWEQRWANNVERYQNLECVKLILPWSTPSMRFCTSELKSAVIASELKKMFGGHADKPIISVTGIRADESRNRAKTPVCQVNARLTRESDGTHGLDWHPIHGWTTPEVYEYLQVKQFLLHEAYRVWMSTRVSCCFCIMSSEADLVAASKCEDNHDIYRRMVGLEVVSTFSFQAGKWLGDVASHLLDGPTRTALEEAKLKCEIREAQEKRIPKRLEYVKGWPTFVPTLEECALIAEVRVNVAAITGMKVNYTTAESVQARYQQLLEEKLKAEETKKRKVKHGTNNGELRRGP